MCVLFAIGHASRLMCSAILERVSPEAHAAPRRRQKTDYRRNLVDIARIVAELKEQRERLSRAILALESGESSGAPRSLPTRNNRRARRLTAAGRARLSEMLKKRWAEAKRKKRNRL